MIDIYYVSADMTGKYVQAGLEVAQDIGGVTVTVQPPGLCSEEKAVISINGRNMQIVDVDHISVKEHAARLHGAIVQLKRKA